MTTTISPVEIIEDRQVRHNVLANGVVITRVVRTRFTIDGVLHDVTQNHWHDWSTGTFHHIDFTDNAV